MEFSAEETKNIGIMLLIGSGLWSVVEQEELQNWLQEQTVERICEWLEAKNGSHATLDEIKKEFQRSL